MNNKKMLITVILLALMWLDLASAAEKEVSLSLSSDRVAPGRQVQLSLIFSAAEDTPPAIPYIDGLNVKYKTTSTAGGVVTHVYNVAAIKPGKYLIGPLTFKYGADTYVSGTASLEVVTGAAASQPKPQVTVSAASELSKRIFLDVELLKTEAYINEEVTVSVKFYTDWLDVENLDISDVPSGRYITDRYVPDGTGTVEENGEKYAVLAFKKKFYVPEAGDFTFGPVEAKFTVVKKKAEPLNPNEDFYNKFIGKKGARDVEMATKTYKVRVLPLPAQGRPAGFKGAIGNYTLEVEASPGKVKPGDTLSLTMKISGTGALRTLTAPDIVPNEGITVSLPEITRDEDGIIATQTMRLDPPGIKVLPEVVFSFFDPDKKRYVSINKELTSVKLEAQAPSVPGISAEGTKEKSGEGVVDAKESPGNMAVGRSDFYDFYKSGAFVFLQMFPIFFLVIVAAVVKYRRMIEADTAYVLSLKASKVARSHMSKARSLLKAGKTDEFYAELFKLMQAYIGTRLARPPDGVTGEIVRFLEADDAREKVSAVFDDFYLARYAPLKIDRGDMVNSFEKVKEALDSLERKRAL